DGGPVCMTDTSATVNMVQFVKDCKKRKADLDVLIDDIEFEQNGGTNNYALDWSEVFAYAVSAANPVELKLFDEDTDDTARAVQHFVLRHLLLVPNRPKPLLFVPYALEARDFFQHDHRKAEDSLVAGAARALLRQRTDSRQFQEVQAFARK